MQPYIASNTGQIVTVDVDEFNPLLREIRSHYPNTSPVLLGRESWMGIEYPTDFDHLLIQMFSE
jgi:hypothetical protein